MVKFVVAFLLTLVCNCAFAQDYSPPTIWVSGSVMGAPLAVKNGSTKWYGTYGSNKSQCRRFLKVFNKKAVDVKLGKDKPLINYEIHPQSNQWLPREVETLLNKGMAVACTRKEGWLDANPAHANECFATVLYK